MDRIWLKSYPPGVPADVEEHIRLMVDLQVLAYKSDINRISTLMLAREISNSVYPASGVVEGFHICSHHSHVEENKLKFARLNQYHVGQLAKFDAILVPGGFGKRGIEGKVAAARFARENKVPYLGICLGMQVATIEYARHVAGLKDANSTEFEPATPNPVIALITEWKDADGTIKTRTLWAMPTLHVWAAAGHRSLREITREAGVVPNAFYRHFRSTDELGLALVEEVGITLRRLLREARQVDEEKSEMVRRSVLVYQQYVKQNRLLFLFISSERAGGSRILGDAGQGGDDRGLVGRGADPGHGDRGVGRPTGFDEPVGHLGDPADRREEDQRVHRGMLGPVDGRVADAHHLVGAVRAVGQRDAGVGRDSSDRGDPGHDLEPDAGLGTCRGLLGAGRVRERVAGDQAHHVRAGLRELRDEPSAGDVLFSPPVTHSPKNIGDTDAHGTASARLQGSQRLQSS